MTVPLTRIVTYCDKILKVSSIKDYDHAVNGLQFSTEHRIRKIAAAVDCNLPIVQKTVKENANLLIVHHGIFWNESAPVTGARFEMFRLLFQHGIAIYSSHLPLDLHPKIGNNALIARKLGLSKVMPFLSERGQALGLKGYRKINRNELAKLISECTGFPTRLIPAGPETAHVIGIVSGAGGTKLVQAAAEGIDTFVTGEGPHWTHILAEDLKVNVIYAGHYATETFGVKALAQLLSKKFGIPWTFIDHPTYL